MITYFPSERVHGPPKCFPYVFILWQLWITKIGYLVIQKVSYKVIDYLEGVWAAKHLIKRAMVITKPIPISRTAYQ